MIAMGAENDLNVRIEAASAAVRIARGTIAELQQAISALSFAVEEAKRRWSRGDDDLRAREAAVLAREDRATIRERELDERERK